MTRARWSGRNGSLFGLVALAILWTAGIGVAAQDTEQDENAIKQNYVYSGTPLDRVLDRIERVSGGMNITIEAEDDEDLAKLQRMPVTLDLNQVDWRTALRMLAKKYRFVIDWEMEQQRVISLTRPPRVTRKFQDAPLKEVINILAEESGSSIVVGDEVTGVVNSTFVDVPWKQALQSVLKTHGYIQVEEEDTGILRITTPEQVQQQMEVKVIALRYLTPQGSLYRAVLHSEFVERIGQDSGEGWSLLNVLEGIKSADGTISYEQRTNQIVMKDTPTRIQEMTDVIREMDRAPLQVQIDTRMLTFRQGIAGENEEEYGVDWDMTLGDKNGDILNLQRTMQGGLEGYQNRAGVAGDIIQDPTEPYDPTDPESEPSLIEFPEGGYYLGREKFDFTTMSVEQLHAHLNMAKRDSTVDILQAPSIVAMDNEEATIHVGDVIRYAEMEVDSESGAISWSEASASPIVAGVQLLVNPRIIRQEERVILTVIPKVEDFEGFEPFGSEGFKLPDTASKTVVTRMMLNDRETGVIAGILTTNEEQRYDKVPILGDVPGLRWLFRTETANNSKDEVRIYITPTILDPEHSESFEEELAQVRGRAAEAFAQE
jgi:type IV pilus assembly protein PilQ